MASTRSLTLASSLEAAVKLFTTASSFKILRALAASVSLYEVPHDRKFVLDFCKAIHSYEFALGLYAIANDNEVICDCEVTCSHKTALLTELTCSRFMSRQWRSRMLVYPNFNLGIFLLYY